MGTIRLTGPTKPLQARWGPRMGHNMSDTDESNPQYSKPSGGAYTTEEHLAAQLGQLDDNGKPKEPRTGPAPESKPAQSEPQHERTDGDNN